MITLIELIFKGKASTLDFTFLEELLEDSKEIYFNSPQTSSTNNFKDIINIISSNDYVDLVITTDHLKIEKHVIPYVFINLGRNENEIELLFFFDLKDLQEETTKGKIDFLREWMVKETEKYSFSYFICQLDNADEDEYYFDSNGIGKLYYEINQ